MELRTKTVVPGLDNTFSGTATPDASLRVLNASGTPIVTTPITADATTGEFNFNRVVSSGAKKLEFKIEQTKNGKTVTSQLFSLAADTAAAPAPVTVDNKTVEAGVENTFTGTGPGDATFRVLNVSNSQIVPGELPIGSDGKWTFDRVVSKTATKFDFKLEVKLADGTTYRTKNFSIAASTFRPVELRTKTVVPVLDNTFSGTATPDASLRVLNASGTPIVTTPITPMPPRVSSTSTASSPAARRSSSSRSSRPRTARRSPRSCSPSRRTPLQHLPRSRSTTRPSRRVWRTPSPAPGPGTRRSVS